MQINEKKEFRGREKTNKKFNAGGREEKKQSQEKVRKTQEKIRPNILNLRQKRYST